MEKKHAADYDQAKYWCELCKTFVRNNKAVLFSCLVRRSSLIIESKGRLKHEASDRHVSCKERQLDRLLRNASRQKTTEARARAYLTGQPYQHRPPAPTTGEAPPEPVPAAPEIVEDLRDAGTGIGVWQTVEASAQVKPLISVTVEEPAEEPVFEVREKEVVFDSDVTACGFRKRKKVQAT